MSEFVPGARVKCATPDGSSRVVGTLEKTGIVGSSALDIRIMGVAYTFTDETGTLKPRWAGAIIEVLSPPRPDMPTLPYALVEASHPDAQQSVWIRLPAGVWRNAGSRLTADWWELKDPVVVHFGGVAR